MVETPTRTPGSLRPALMPGLLLMLTFAGIWTCDGAVLRLVDPPGGGLSMRVISLAAYAAALVMAARFSRLGNGTGSMPGPPARRALAVAVGCGFALFALGAGSALLVPSIAGTIPSLAVLALTKCIGPFLSAALLLRFAALPRRALTAASVVGFAGAFVLEQVIETAASSLGWSAATVLAPGSAFLLAACAAIMANLLRVHDACPALLGAAHDNARTAPLRSFVDRKLAAGLVVAAMMLGFLNAGSGGSTPTGATATIVALVAVALAAWRIPALDARELFRAALVCTTAGLLLGPVLASITADAPALLLGVGTTLFEAVVWNASAVAVRSCAAPLDAAIRMRLAVVGGHLAGTLVASAAAAASVAHPEAQQAAALAIVFAYVVMLLYLINNPLANLALLLEGEGAFAAGNATPPPDSPHRAATGDGDADGGAFPAEPTPSNADAQYWKRPCASLAEQHGLTPRETDVLEQLAQGRDLGYMEDLFVLSRNTVKMHIRHVYAKLGVHSKQDVIDLVEAARTKG